MANTSFDQPLQLHNREPIFFDQKRFVEDLNSRNPIKVFKDALSAAKNHFDNRFLEVNILFYFRPQTLYMDFF